MRFVKVMKQCMVFSTYRDHVIARLLSPNERVLDEAPPLIGGHYVVGDTYEARAMETIHTE